MCNKGSCWFGVCVGCLILGLALAGCGGGSPSVSSNDLESPASVTASQGNYPDRIELSWVAVPGATEYIVQDGKTHDQLAIVSSTTWSDTALGTRILRTYQVAGRNASQTGYLSHSIQGYRSVSAGEPGGSGGPGSWPCSRGMPGCSGVSSLAGPLTAARAWEFGRFGSDEGADAPLIADDGTIYISFRDELVAFNITDGSRKWSIEFDNMHLVGLTADGRIIGRVGYTLFGMEPDGRMVWIESIINLLGQDTYSDPTINCITLNGAGLIYLASDETILGISLEGTALWQLALPQKSNGYGDNTVLNDGSLVVSSVNGELYAVSPQGSLVWRQDAVSRLDWEDPMVAANGNLLCTLGGRLQVISPEGQIIHQAADDVPQGQLIGLGSGTTAFIAVRDGSAGSCNVYSVDWSIDYVDWELPGQGFYLNSAVHSQTGTTYLGTTDSLVAISNYGSVTWEHDFEWGGSNGTASLAFGQNGELVYVSNQGAISVFKDADGAPGIPQGTWATQGLYETAISVHWNMVPGALTYDVIRVGDDQPVAFGVAKLRWVDTDPGSGQVSYQVRAHNTEGTGNLCPAFTGSTATQDTTDPAWPQPGFSADRTNHCDYTGPGTYHQKWFAAEYTDSWYDADVYIGRHGMVYVAQNGIQAFTPNGRLEWSDSEVYDHEVFITADGNLHCKRYSDVMSLTPYGTLIENCLPVEGSLEMIGPDGELYFEQDVEDDDYAKQLTVVDPDGSTRCSIRPASTTSPTVGPSGNIYLTRGTGSRSGTWDNMAYISTELVAYDNSGRELWHYNPWDLVEVTSGTLLSVRFSAPVVTADESIYIKAYYVHEIDWDPHSSSRTTSTRPPMPTMYHFIVALNPNGTLRWKRDGLAYMLAEGPDNGLYLIEGGYWELVRLLDRAGAELWVAEKPDRDLGGRVDAVIVDAAWNVYVKAGAPSLTGGYITALDKTGNQLWYFGEECTPLEEGQMAMSTDGVLYYVQKDGPLVAIGNE